MSKIAPVDAAVACCPAAAFDLAVFCGALHTIDRPGLEIPLVDLSAVALAATSVAAFLRVAVFAAAEFTNTFSERLGETRLLAACRVTGK
jgi:hypothetical protein